MKIHYLQHVSFEGPGYITQWLEEHHHAISATRFYEADYSLPLIDDIDALIIMGGPMSVYDEEQYPWLKEEKAFITSCIKAQKPVLGICLGAQLIASCLGGTINKASNKEIGWHPVYPSKEYDNTSWFYDLFKNMPNVFHWHGEQFTIPTSAGSNLLNSEGNDNQAFIYRDNIIGLQFHIEVDEPAIRGMIENCASDFDKSLYVQPIEAIMNRNDHIGNAHKIADKILSRLCT